MHVGDDNNEPLSSSVQDAVLIPVQESTIKNVYSSSHISCVYRGRIIFFILNELNLFKNVTVIGMSAMFSE